MTSADLGVVDSAASWKRRRPAWRACCWIHTAAGGRIRYRKICELEGQVLRQDEIARGWETATGTMIPVTDEDLDNLPLPTAKAIDIVSFVPAASIQIGASYYLAATETVAAKPTNCSAARWRGRPGRPSRNSRCATARGWDCCGSKTT